MLLISTSPPTSNIMKFSFVLVSFFIFFIRKSLNSNYLKTYETYLDVELTFELELLQKEQFKIVI